MPLAGISWLAMPEAERPNPGEFGFGEFGYGEFGHRAELPS
jgi:hypothetical protein